MNKFEIPPKKGDVVDEEIYSEFTSIKQLAAYTYLAGEREYRLDMDTLQDEKIMKAGVREKSKHEFLSGDVRNPSLTYPKLEKFDTVATEQEFLKLKERIKTETKDETIKKLYLWKINEKIAENRMLQAAQNGDDKRFVRYSIFINGKPDRKIFEYTLSRLLIDTKQAINNNSNILAQEAAKRLRKQFGEFLNLEDTLTLQYSKVDPKKLSLQHTDEKFQIEEIKEKDKLPDIELSDQEIATEFTKVLEQYELSDWEVIIDPDKTNIHMGKKKIFIPKDKEVSLKKLRGLIAHEIDTHVIRRENGQRSKLKLLTLGLDRYGYDEGIAMYKQQQIEGMKDFAGFDGYLAISLAMGMDGKKRDFRNVFEILVDYYIMKGKNPNKAMNIAWARCVRTFRGTSGKTPGACFTKDLFYRENNIGVWNLVKKNSPEVRRFMVGKYDPTNPRHIWILDQLNITEKDLEILEK